MNCVDVSESGCLVVTYGDNSLDRSPDLAPDCPPAERIDARDCHSHRSPFVPTTHGPDQPVAAGAARCLFALLSGPLTRAGV